MTIKDYAVTVENLTRNLLFINLETLAVEYTIDTGYGVIDVAAASDNKTLLASAYYQRKLIEIDLTVMPPEVVKVADLPSEAEDVALTPDNKFALITDGDSDNTNLISVLLADDAVNYTPVSSQAVFASSNEKVFIARTTSDRIRLYNLLSDGKLVDTSMESIVFNPINLAGTSDGNFLFACSDSDTREIAVLDISNPDYYGVASRYPTQSIPQSIVVNRANDRLYVLEENHIEILDFNSVSKRLTNINTVYHGQNILLFYGVDQLALSPDEEKLIMSAKKVFIYNVNGTLENTLDIDTYGGVATYSVRTPAELANTVAITDEKDLVLVSTDTLQEVERLAFDDVKYSLLNVAIGSDGKYALVTTLYDNIVYKLDIAASSHISLTVDSYLDGVLFSDNPRYGIIYGSNLYGVDYASYITTLDLENNMQVKSPANTQYLGINPVDNTRLLGSRTFADRIRLYYLNEAGMVYYSDQEISTGGYPGQVVYSPDGSFAFAIDKFSENIYVLDTSSSNYFGVASVTHAKGAACRGIAVDIRGKFVYLVTSDTVETYSFDAAAKRLSLVRYFDIDYAVADNYFGIVPLLLDEYHQRLLVLGTFKLVAYSLYGVKFGEFPLNNAKSCTLYRDNRF